MLTQQCRIFYYAHFESFILSLFILSLRTFSLHIAVNYFTSLSSFTHVDNDTDDNADENNTTSDDATKCSGVVADPLHLASTLVAVVVWTLIVASTTAPVIKVSTYPVCAYLAIRVTLVAVKASLPKIQYGAFR